MKKEIDIGVMFAEMGENEFVSAICDLLRQRELVIADSGRLMLAVVEGDKKGYEIQLVDSSENNFVPDAPLCQCGECACCGTEVISVQKDGTCPVCGRYKYLT